MLRSIINGSAVVGLGTAAGQGVVLLATPWLARQYTPEEFGVLALLITVCNISTAAACLRYDMVLPSVAEERASVLFKVALSSAMLSAILVGLILGLGRLIETQWQPPFDTILPVLLCVGLVGVQQAFIGMVTKKRQFAGIGAIRFGQGATFSLLALIPGAGLVWAQVFSFLVVLPGVFRQLASRRVSWRDISAAAFDYRDFPLKSLPGALFDVLGYSACIWIITYHYGSHEAGQYSQIQRIVGAPLMLAGVSIGQVLLRVGPDVIHDPPSVHMLLRQLLRLAGALGLIVIAIVSFAGEPLLGWLLGAQWRVEPAFVIPIVIAVTVRACVSPLSTFLITLRRFDLTLRWQSLYFLSSWLFLWVAAAQFDPYSFVLVYAVHELILYGVYLHFIVKAIRELPCAAFSA